MSHEKRAPGWLGYIGDEKLPSYMGIIINHYKDPYQPTSIMESRRVFFVVQMALKLDNLGGGNSNIFYFHHDPWGFMIQFDEHIFQLGWFNHQLVTV